MEGCLYFIALIIAVFAIAFAVSVIIATIMSFYTLLVHRRWNWHDHFSSVFSALLSVASFFLTAPIRSSSRSSSDSSSRSSGSDSSGGFGGGSSRGGGSGRSF